MILDEVVRFRHSVRRQPMQNQPQVDIAAVDTASTGAPAGMTWGDQAPKPQEVGVTGQDVLEAELAGGLDAHGRLG